jgi:SagB-type dehydrogenase family enzyme
MFLICQRRAWTMCAQGKPPKRRSRAEPGASPAQIGREFMEKTRYQYLGASDQRRGAPPPPLELGYDEGQALFDLPRPEDVSVEAIDLRVAIEMRVSVRQYAETPLTLAELSYLLWCTQGVKHVEGDSVTLRTVPSAGARHALETYLLVNRVQGLEPGLYRFLAIEHKLLAVDVRPDVAELVTQACWNQRMVLASAVTYIWAAVPYRMAWRYGQRGYRYLHLDVGHVCQNLYLAAPSVGCGTCAIAAFSDEDMSRTLDIDGVEQFAIYVATVGKTR